MADSPEAFVADILAKTHGEADPVLARALAEVSARLVEWMADDLAVPLSLVTDFPYPGHSSFRCHTVPGRIGTVLLDLLMAQVTKSELIDMYVPARLIDVLAPDGVVSGVIVETPEGREEIPTRAVLLATNGFGANRELVQRYIPEIAGAVYHGSEESTGDALRIGAKLGAESAYLDAYQGHAALAMPSATLAGWATVMHGGLLVNSGGERFGDETQGYSEYAKESLAHADGRSWIIIDQRIHDSCLSFQDFRDTVETGGVRWAGDAQALAAQIGVDADGLKKTLVRARNAALGTAADSFGRMSWEARWKAGWAPSPSSLPSSTPKAA
ncbi:fumarate reductase [Arthrobacter sp. Hiyo4]|nr:fumarate reductase [Arthrobacter sp. Hiyo4]